MKQQDMCVFGAPWKAEHQLVELERCGHIDTILTTDTDLVPLGANHIMFDLRLNNGNLKELGSVSYSRKKVIGHPNFADLNLYKQFLPKFSSLLGTDYWRRIPKHGAVAVMRIMRD